ncbi:hypothetical protein [Leuconostoc citreum]|uniref:hypothetical protein n=1 Tax=Leuconostoc citreum TaxID=33964 RepID=UPI00186B6FA1|nr:hypothetical protein [Leuconostoc citreum]MBE4726725.1 hypothetical protein [Leuconostoc citreum]
MKTKIAIYTAVASITLSALTAVKANADTTSQTSDNTTTVTFTAPTNGGLTLDHVPDINYGSHDLTINPVQTFAGTLQKDSDGKNTISVTNLTGANNKYSVVAKATDLSSVSASVKASALTIASADGVANQIGGLMSGVAETNILGTANQTILTSGASGNNSGTVTSGALSSNLTVGTNNLLTGAYTGTLTYTLQPDV